MTHFQHVFAPIQRPTSFETRPGVFLKRLLADAAVHHHGGDAAGRVPWTSVIRRAPKAAYPGRSAVLSPAFITHAGATSDWVDLYDDWSIAPDIHPIVRRICSRNYRRAASSLRGQGLLTVNSRYMALKLRRQDPVVLPNGVDESLATVPIGVEDRRSLLIMGNFFPGRTDYGLIRAALSSPVVEQFICVGADKLIEDLVRSLDGRQRRKVLLLPKTPLRQVAPLLSPCSVWLIPHLVTDYTMSQDALKVYQSAALGVRVLLPYQLFPRHVDPRFLIGLSPVPEISVLLARAFALQPLSSLDRNEFVGHHGWDVRLRQLQRLLAERSL